MCFTFNSSITRDSMVDDNIYLMLGVKHKNNGFSTFKCPFDLKHYSNLTCPMSNMQDVMYFTLTSHYVYQG